MDFKVNVRNEEFKVKFQSKLVENPTKEVPINVRQTICYVSRTVGGTRLEVASGVVTQHSRDKDIKRLGQQRALAEAFKHTCIPFTKNEKKVFWDEFRGVETE